MDRGDVLVFDTDREEYVDWKYFRAINATTEENRDNEKVEAQTGAKMYLTGNVYTKKKEVLKAQKFFIGDFLKMYQEEEVRVADDADVAVIFLTDKNF